MEQDHVADGTKDGAEFGTSDDGLGRLCRRLEWHQEAVHHHLQLEHKHRLLSEQFACRVVA